MKKFYSIVILLFIACQSSFCWQKADVMRSGFIVNPYNDKEIVFVGPVSSTSEIYSFTIDLISGRSISNKLNFNDAYTVNAAIINSVSERIGYLAGKKIYVCNYMSMDKITEITTSFNFINPNIKVDFSKNGSLIYILNKDDLRLVVYDATTGAKNDELLINSNPNLYFGVFLNPEKEEFALGRNDSVEFWSLKTKSLIRTIPFNSKAEKVQFRLKGEQISFLTDSKELYVVNSQTGNEILHKSNSINIDYYEFSANMKYLVYSGAKQYQYIFDTQADTIIKSTEYPGRKKGEEIYFYITSDYKSAFGYEYDLQYCSKDMEMPLDITIYFTYDLTKQSRITSIPDGYVSYPRNIVINDLSSLISVWGGNENNKNNYYFNALLNANGNFIKYISSDMKPQTFIPKSDLLILTDSNKILFYNITTDIIEKSLEINGRLISKIFFIPGNSELMFILDSISLNVYNFSNFSLKYSIDIESEGKIINWISCGNTGKINYIANLKELYSFNPLTGISTLRELTNIPLGASLAEVSPDDNYLLLKLKYDTLLVYDINLQKVIYKYHEKNFAYASGLESCGFMGNYKLVWFSYITNPIDKSVVFVLIDMTNGAVVNLAGEAPPFITKDGLYYATVECPHTYYFNPVPIPVSIEENNNTQIDNIIYPNPAKDYIEINFERCATLDNCGTSDKIQIFNMLGETVLIVEQTSPSVQKIDISCLPPGMYFIKIGNRVEKFVKM